MKKLLISIIILCSLQSQAQVSTSTWNNFLVRYKADTTASNSVIRKQQATIAALNDKVTKLETLVTALQVTPGESLKITNGVIDVNFSRIDSRIDSNANWARSIMNYAVFNFRQQTARTDSLVKSLPDMFTVYSRITWLETSNSENGIILTELKAWADRIKLITLQ